MKSSHRFPLRRQIVWGMRFFTILTSLAVGAALFTLSNQYVRANSLQAAEFNLRLVATSIETSLDSADALLNWASIDSTVRRYISQENINGTQTIAAYEAVQEKYYSSTLYSHILRFFITNENDRHLQFGTLNSSAALNRTSIKQFLPKGYGMQFTTDPLLPGSPDCIALSQPVRCGKGTLHRGSTYLALDTAIITDPAAGYSLTDGSALYWEMGSRLWQIENGSLTETENRLREVDYTLRTGSNNGVTEQTAWQGKVQLDGQKYYVVKVTLNGRSAALVQLLPANTFLLHYGVDLWLITLGIDIIWGLSILMQHWLEWVITRPVEALQKRIETVGSGNFAPDRTVEWNNELGDIGRGINQLAENVGLTYLGPVDGHNMRQMMKLFNEAKRVEGPVVVHVLTEKGRGYGPASSHPERFHGTGPFDIQSGRPLAAKTAPTYTNHFSGAICSLAEKNRKIVAITAAMPDGTGLNQFRKKFPERFFDVGIAEEHAVTFAADGAVCRNFCFF